MGRPSSAAIRCRRSSAARARVQLPLFDTDQKLAVGCLSTKCRIVQLVRGPDQLICEGSSQLERLRGLGATDALTSTPASARLSPAPRASSRSLLLRAPCGVRSTESHCSSCACSANKRARRAGFGGSSSSIARSMAVIRSLVDLSEERSVDAAVVGQRRPRGQLGVGQRGRDPRSLEQRLAVGGGAGLKLGLAEPDQRLAPLAAVARSRVARPRRRTASPPRSAPRLLERTLPGAQGVVSRLGPVDRRPWPAASATPARRDARPGPARRAPPAPRRRADASAPAGSHPGPVQRLVDQRMSERETAQAARLTRPAARRRPPPPRWSSSRASSISTARLQQLEIERRARSPPPASGPRASHPPAARPGARSPRARSRATRRRGAIDAPAPTGLVVEQQRPTPSRLRSTSPTKNGLPSVSAAISPASSTPSWSSSWPAAAARIFATSSAPSPCKCEPLEHRPPGEDRPARWSADGPCPDRSRDRRRSVGAPCSTARTTCLSSATDWPSARCKSSSTRHNGTQTQRPALSSPATAENSR